MFGDDEKRPARDDIQGETPAADAKTAPKDQVRSQGAYQFNDWAAI